MEMEEKYGIDVYHIPEYSANYSNFYYIDGREVEEYNYMRKENSVHLRTYDINNKYDIINAIGITEKEFEDSLFIIFCHDGTRSEEVAEKINLPNVKFFIGGVAVLFDYNFPEGDVLPNYIVNKDYVTSPEVAHELVREGAFLIDGRCYEDDLFKDVYRFRIGQLSTEDYNERIKEIVAQKGNKIVFIADGHADTFYVKLLIYRLEKNYDFDYEDFYLVFGQNKEFSELLNNNEK
jgi:rhodanese-related sulfurtransferase